MSETQIHNLVDSISRLKGRAESLEQMLVREGEKLSQDDYVTLLSLATQLNELASRSVIMTICRILATSLTPV